MQIRYYLSRFSIFGILSLTSYVTMANVEVSTQIHPSRTFRTKKRITTTPSVPHASVRALNSVRELNLEISPNEVQTISQDTTAPLVAKGKVAMQQRKDSITKSNTQNIEPELVIGYIPPAELRPTESSTPKNASQEAQTEPELLVAKGTEVAASTIDGGGQDAQHAEPELSLEPKEVHKTDFVAKGSTPLPVASPTQAPMKGIPWMVFDSNREEVDFGKIRLGERPSHTFLFTNHGDTDLEIEMVSTCECTIVEYSKEKIAPGASGFVKAIFNSNGVYPEGVNRLNEKEITIILKNTYPTNGYPIVKTLLVKAFVE